MHRFHVAIHAAPQAAPAVETRHLDDRPIDVLVLQPGQLSDPIPVSFEAALAALELLPRMFIEPDGSFVWVAQQGEPTWQVDGLLFDRAGQLVYVELKGCCPADRLDMLLATLGWPAVPLVFQLVREAVFLDEARFRTWTLAARERDS